MARPSSKRCRKRRMRFRPPESNELFPLCNGPMHAGTPTSAALRDLMKNGTTKVRIADFTKVIAAPVTVNDGSGLTFLQVSIGGYTVCKASGCQTGDFDHRLSFRTEGWSSPPDGQRSGRPCGSVRLFTRAGSLPLLSPPSSDDRTRPPPSRPPSTPPGCPPASRPAPASLRGDLDDLGERVRRHCPPASDIHGVALA